MFAAKVYSSSAIQCARSVNDGRSGIEHLFHDASADVGQSVVAPLAFERQSRVVDAQAVQHRGVQIVDVDGVWTYVVARNRRSRRR